MMAAGTIQILPLKIERSGHKKGALEILKTTKPSWNTEIVQFKVFTEGITNSLIGCYLPNNPDDMVLVRIYGDKTELIIDREAEKQTFCILNAAGLSPPLFCVFENGMAYGYIKGKPIDERSVRDEKVCVLIAKKMAKFHSVKEDNGAARNCQINRNGGGNGTSDVFFFNKLQSFISLAPDHFDEPERQEIFLKEVKSKEFIQKEFDTLRPYLKTIDCPVVFCHNDLLLQNIVYDEENDSVGFIDYEYAFRNFQAYDIGNHFNEYAGIDEVDYSLYPDQDYQLRWLRTYLQSWFTENGKSASEVTDKDVEKLYVQVNKCSLASHFFWGVWALLQARYSKIDFDFLAYAVIRLKEYFRKKDEILSSSEL